MLFVLLTDNRFQVSCIAVDDPLQSRVEVYMYGGTEQDITSMTSYDFFFLLFQPLFFNCPKLVARYYLPDHASGFIPKCNVQRKLIFFPESNVVIWQRVSSYL